MQIELIEWLDSFGAGHTWTKFDDIDKEVALTCMSVGYVVRETERYLLVVPHIHGDLTVINTEREIRASGCGDMAIPKASVVRRVVLREVTADKMMEAAD